MERSGSQDERGSEVSFTELELVVGAFIKSYAREFGLKRTSNKRYAEGFGNFILGKSNMEQEAMNAGTKSIAIVSQHLEVSEDDLYSEIIQEIDEHNKGRRDLRYKNARYFSKGHMRKIRAKIEEINY